MVMQLPPSLLPDLPALLVIAEECHFGRAAERLNVSQPRVSQVARRFEDVLGYPVFVRRPSIRLTPAGELLIGAARDALHDLALGLVRAGDVAAGRRGIVRLGYAPVAMMTRLPQIIKSFHERNPLVDLQMQTTYSANLWTAFDAGELDLIVTRERRDRKGIATHLFVRDSFVAVLPASDPSAKHGELSIAALANRDFVASDEALAPQWHERVGALCSAAGFEPRVTQRSNDWGATLALVASGLGVAIVSSTLAHIRFPGIRFVTLKESSDDGAFWIASHRNRSNATIDSLLLELLGGDVSE